MQELCSLSEEIWDHNYRFNNEKSVTDLWNRLSEKCSSIENEKIKDKIREKFYYILSDFKFVPGGRTMANLGTDRGSTTLMNCFVHAPKDLGFRDPDSIEGIYEMLKAQAHTLKSEGGYGMNFSWIRPKGTYIQGIDSRTPGVVKFMELWDKSSEIITMGSDSKVDKGKKSEKKKIRKGAMMGVLSVWHPEIIDFIGAKQTPNRLTKFNVSVGIFSDFMDRVINDQQWDLKFPDTSFERYKTEWDGDIYGWEAKGYPIKIYKTIQARELWELMMYSTYTRNEPGVLFFDIINKYNPLSYSEFVQTTNPSLRKGTKVLTKDGIFSIEKLENQEFLVQNLHGDWKLAKCFLSGKNKRLWKIKLKNNYEYFCTEEHKWPVKTIGNSIIKGSVKDLHTKDLLYMPKQESLDIIGNLTYKEGFAVGWLYGDGWLGFRKDKQCWHLGFIFNKYEKYLSKPILDLINNMKENKSKLNDNKDGTFGFSISDRDFCKKFLNLYGISHKSEGLPTIIWRSNDSFIKGIIDGLFSSDGHIHKFNNKIVLTSRHKKLLIDIQELLGFYGIKSTINKSINESHFPNGTSGVYTRYDLNVCGKDSAWFGKIFKLSHIEKQKRLVNLIDNCKKNRLIHYNDSIEIASIEKTDIYEDVWDITVFDETHTFKLSHGITGNCGEICMSAGVCNLGSLNLTQFVEHEEFSFENFRETVRWSVRFLDNINDISGAPLPEYKESMVTKRRIGLGTMGLGSLHFMLGIRYGSPESLDLIDKIYRTKAETEILESARLGQEKGSFKQFDREEYFSTYWWKTLPISDEIKRQVEEIGEMRNSHRSMNAPTGNTSTFANLASGGIEPVFMKEYIRWMIVPESDRMALKERGLNFPDVYNGAWHETEHFSFSQRGDEQVLKGTFEGVDYEIDRNRGLIKASLVEDFGWKHIKEHKSFSEVRRLESEGFLATTEELTVDEHVNVLRTISKYIDQNSSKTTNLPNNYSYEDFKELYLNAWHSNIKGMTTYRAGTMTAVLEKKKELEEYQNELDELFAKANGDIIADVDVKLPREYHSKGYIINDNNKKKWYIHVAFADSKYQKPFALFVNTNTKETTEVADAFILTIETLCRDKGIREDLILHQQEKYAGQTNATRIARAIGMSLRHNIKIVDIVESLDKFDHEFSSLIYHLKKLLSKFIKDGTEVKNEKCPQCEQYTIVYQEGCMCCKTCMYSKC